VQNGWSDRFAVWVVDSGGPKEAQVQSYSPSCANVPSWEGTPAPPGEYDWTVRLQRRCGLTSNYFDHLLELLRRLIGDYSCYPSAVCLPQSSINEIPQTTSTNDFPLNSMLIDLVSYKIVEKFKMAAPAMLNLTGSRYSHKLRCTMTSYVYIGLPNFVQVHVSLTVPLIMVWFEIYDSYASRLPELLHAKILDHSRRLFGDRYMVAKVHGDLICCFEIIANLIIRQFGLKCLFT